MPDHTPFVARALLALLAVALLLAAPRLRRTRGAAPANTALGIAAAVAVLAYTNLFRFHGPGPLGGFVHTWEHFHYQLGSKYFPELGYDGLYAASVAAQRETGPALPAGLRIRDQHSYALVPVTSAALDAVRARFSAARWRSFVRDHRYYQQRLPASALAAIRTDHGYNPTPAWTFVARLFTRGSAASGGTLTALALLDVAALLGAFLAVGRTFGAAAACLALVVFGTGHGWRFYYNGGALLRYDWLAATLVGLCLLKRERHAAAGLLIGYAAMARLFPALLLLGPLLVALRGARRARAVPPPLLRLGLGFAAAVGLGLAAGALAGRGPAAWLEFADKIELHRSVGSPATLSLAAAVGGAPELMAALVRGRPPDAWPRSVAQTRALRAQRRGAALAIGLALGALGLAAAWRASPLQATGLGLIAVFLALDLDSYYWVWLALLPLAGARAPALAVVAISALLCAVHGGVAPERIASPSAAGLASLPRAAAQAAAVNAVLHAAASTALALVFAAWAARMAFSGPAAAAAPRAAPPAAC